jgi:hypothetical protein
LDDPVVAVIGDTSRVFVDVTPTDEQFSIAIEWLDVKEGDSSDAEACKVFAAWLSVQSGRASPEREPDSERADG